MRYFTPLMVLLLMLLAFDAHGSEADLRRFFATVDTLQATFDQKVVDETGQTLEYTRGTVSLSRPGKFRWNYDVAVNGENQGVGQQIVADGESIYLYDPDLEQVTQRGLEDALGQVPSLLLVQQGSKIDEYFSITDIGLTDGLSWVLLKPKDADAAYRQLMIGFDESVLATIMLLDGLGNETRLSLSEVQTNLQLEDDLFTFVVPDGADVYRQ
jgi:outer membrane lipoprotein carrier protein